MAEIIRIGNSDEPGKANVRTMLIETLEDLDRGELDCQKAVLIFLDESRLGDDGDKTYDLRMRTAGVRCSELLSMFQVATARALAWMGFYDQ